MAKVIAVCNQKGGSGKTTIAINLCGALTELDRSVVLIDADHQATASEWSRVKPEARAFALRSLPSPTLHVDLGEIARDYDYTVVDCPPGGERGCDEINRSALMSADLVLVPVQPSAFDVWSTRGTMRLIERVREQRPSLRAMIVISRRIPNTVIGADARGTAANLGPVVAKSEISQRVATTESGVAGETVLAYEPGGHAAEEFRALAKEIERWARR